MKGRTLALLATALLSLPVMARAQASGTGSVIGRIAAHQLLPGAFPRGVNYGFENKKTYTNEFSAGWEKQLPNSSSAGVTFILERTLDFQGTDDENIMSARVVVRAAATRPDAVRLLQLHPGASLRRDDR